ncbi:solute carrier family 25 (mitochondrial S-adenosylmethionine transporter), member 26 [Marchantia polymorpha subsp. ruderalis]
MESSEDSRTTTRMNNRGGEWASSSSSSTCASVRVTWSSGTKLAAAGDSGAGCGPCSSWEWQALVPGCSSDDDDDEEMMMARAFAGISVSNFLKGGKGRRGKDKHSAQSGWPLLQQMFGHVVGARSRASSLVKQVSLLERAGIGALAGGIAGGFTNVTLHPIDTVKTKLQTKGASQMYSGPLDVVSKVLASQGIAGLYSGVQAAFLGSVMSSSVYFGTYELAKGIFSSVANWPEALVPPFAAVLGNITSSAILVPKEVIKQRMQAGAAGTARHVFMSTIQNDGVLGLYAGYSAALLRNLPTNIISFSTFEYLKMAWLSGSDKVTLEPWQSVISGAVAGALSGTVTTPLDLVKTRLMTQARAQVSITGLSGTRAEAAARAQAVAEYTYKGVASTLKRIWVEEGPKGLMKGVGPRAFYSALFSAIGFLAFESTRHFILDKHLEQRDAKREKQREAEREAQLTALKHGL